VTAVAAPELIQPNYLWVPPRFGSSGGEATDLAESLGLSLDPEQRLAVDAILSEGPGSEWAALEAAIIIARQNGKTMRVILPVVLADLFLFGASLVAWTAHRFVTCQEAFRALKAVIDANDSLSSRVKRISEANGEEEVELVSGARVKFLARSKTGGRGLTGNRIVLDEAFALEPAHMGSLLPTLATKRDAQVVYGSSGGMKTSEILRDIRDRGRAGGDPSLAYIEWCAPDPACEEDDCDHHKSRFGCSADDEDYWRAANPAMVRGRITPRFIQSMRRTLPAEEFVREFLTWWDDPVGGAQLPLELWSKCEDRGSAPTSRPVLTIDVAPNSKSAAIIATMRRPDGLPHLEIVDHAPRADWVVARAAELKAHSPLDWTLDPAGPAGALLPDLAKVGIEPRLLSTRDLGQACEGFALAVAARKVRHLGDAAWSRAIAGAGRRDIGDGLWAWSRRRSEADITVLVGGSIGVWALETAEEEKPPPAPPVMESLESGDMDGPDLLNVGF
jgi:hypothetical protein